MCKPIAVTLHIDSIMHTWARVDEIWVSDNFRAFCSAASHPCDMCLKSASSIKEPKSDLAGTDLWNSV